MQIFELHFNPVNKERKTIDSFCYQPEDVYEKRLGVLAIGGILKETNSNNKTFLNNLLHKLRSIYYTLPTKTQEEALSEALSEANEFISDNKIKNGISIAVISIKKEQLEFSRIGNIKILLSRNEEIIDIGKNVEDETEIFGSMISGKIRKDDKLIILTEDIYQNFLKQNLLSRFTIKENITEKDLEIVSKTQKDKFPKTVGVCIIIDFSIENKKENAKIINKEEFSFSKTALKYFSEFKKVAALVFSKTKSILIKVFTELKKWLAILLDKLTQLIKKITPKILEALKSATSFLKDKVKKVKTAPKLKPTKIIKEPNKKETEKELEKGIKNKKPDKDNFNFLIFFKNEAVTEYKNIKEKAKKIEIKKHIPSFKKISLTKDEDQRNFIYLGALFFAIILIGSFITHSERTKQLEHQREKLKNINNIVSRIDINHEDSFLELIYHHQNVTNMIKRRTPLESQTINLKNKIESKLLEISQTEIIKDLSLVFETTEIVPSKMKLIEESIYLYNPFLSVVEKYDTKTSEKLIRPIQIQDGGIFSIASIDSTLYYFNRPNRIIVNNSLYELSPPYPDYSYQQMTAFNDSLYFLERRNNQIIEYKKTDLEDPIHWIEERKPGEIISFAIDGTVWILKADNKIWPYQEKRPLPGNGIYSDNIFPFPEKFTLIRTDSQSDLYLLEPRNKRVVVFSKEGELINQLIFPEADNLKDFVIDFSNKKIYLLDGQKVYSAKLN